MVARWDPFRDLTSIQNELNRLFGRAYAGTDGAKGILAMEIPKREEARPERITIKAKA